ncbi:hypothetical protein J0S82_012805 [Galemys pyrenaicus]|uniref:Uncharacterized protein n=1 Tax=Galemys pyrenaicus TaxID=202257 RepID=A0A8J6A7B5_GALPY|nr:hypothetical protein J0S82_012805 [Galemys pyrenaicus]
MGHCSLRLHEDKPKDSKPFLRVQNQHDDHTLIQELRKPSEEERARALVAVEAAMILKNNRNQAPLASACHVFFCLHRPPSL